MKSKTQGSAIWLGVAGIGFIIVLAGCQSKPASTLSGKLGEAAVVFDQRLQSNQQDLRAKVGKAVILRMDGQIDQAQKLLLEVLSVDQNMAEAHAALGGILMDGNRTKEARKAFERAVELQSSLVDAQAALGRLDLLDGNYSDAVKHLNKALEGLEDPYVRADRAKAYAELGAVAEAEADYQVAIAANPSDSFTYLDRGRMRARAGKFKEALADFNQALALSPNFTIVYMYRGQAADMTGDSQTAISDYEKILANRPGYGPILEPLATLYLEQGRYRDAAKLFQTGFSQTLQNDRSLLFAAAALLLSTDAQVRADAVKLALSFQPQLNQTGILYQVARSYVDFHQENQTLLAIEKLPKGEERGRASILTAVALLRTGTKKAAEELALRGRTMVPTNSTEDRLAAVILGEPRKPLN